MDMPLNYPEVSALPKIEQYWLKHHSFPPVGQIENLVPNFSMEESLKHDLFRLALKNRGIKIPFQEDSPAEILDPDQLSAIALIANFRDKRPPSAKLKTIGVTWTQWQGWLKQKEFKEFLHKLSGENFMDSLDVAQGGILSAVEKGNIDAAKFYLELTGRYTPQTQEVANIKLVLTRLLEIIQIHVKDPNLLRAIATDFERVMQGGIPEVPKEITI